MRYAFRSLIRTPWYTGTVVLVLSLALTAAATVFAVVDGVLLKPLPYAKAADLFALEGGWQARPELLGNVTASLSDFTAWADAAPAARLAMFSLGGREQVDDGPPVRSAQVSADFLDVLGQPAMIGGFRPEHFLGRRPIKPALVSYDTWQRRLGGDPAVGGRIVRGDRDAALEIVGVLPPGFLFPVSDGRFVPDVLTPLIVGSDASVSRSRGYQVIARADARASVELQNRLQAATEAVARRFPKVGDRPGPFDRVRVQPLDLALRSRTQQTFTLVMLAASVLLLVACGNVTGLSTARAEDREREMALRRAVGAGRSQLVRLVAAESLLLAALSGGIGAAGSALLLPVVGAVLPPNAALLKPLAMDGRAALFVAAASLACVLLTAAWPAWVVLRQGTADAGLVRTSSRRRVKGRTGLVVVQVACGLVMLLGGALVARSLIAVWREDPGYRVNDALAIWVTGRAEESRAQIEALLDDLRGLPGVASAGGSNLLLLQRAVRGNAFDPPAGIADSTNVESVGVTAGFFESTGLRPTAGRWPTSVELESGAPVVIVSERIARAYWGSQPAVGQRLVRRRQAFDVVGVVPDARYLALDLDPEGAIYYPLAADAQPSLITIFVAVDPLRPASASSIAGLLTAHGGYRVRSAQTVGSTLAESIRQRRFYALLFGGFGVLALFIVPVGILGLVATATVRRTREVGVRMAVGARPWQIVGVVLRGELAGIVGGLTVGVLLGLWSVRPAAPFLYKTGVYDPAAWAASIAVLLSASIIGILLPGLRASRLDPVVALRAE
jgi:predicted permease